MIFYLRVILSFLMHFEHKWQGLYNQGKRGNHAALYHKFVLKIIPWENLFKFFSINKNPSTTLFRRKKTKQTHFLQSRDSSRMETSQLRRDLPMRLHARKMSHQPQSSETFFLVSWKLNSGPRECKGYQSD